MKHAKTLAISIAMGSLTLSGCQQVTGSQAVGADTAAAQSPADVTPLAGLFDCVREEGGILLAAHRGGPAPGYPENAIETLDHVLSNAAFIMEVDVAETRDGVLFLMHDDTLVVRSSVSSCIRKSTPSLVSATSTSMMNAALESTWSSVSIAFSG